MLDIFKEGGQTLVIGLSITFAALILLIVCIRVMSAALRKKRDDNVQPMPEIIPAAAQDISAAPAEDEGEVIAAIMAALAVISQQTGSQFRLKAFRRAQGSNAWARAGRQDILNSRY
jgi:sodium pump decarboxylase gamma subunit